MDIERGWNQDEYDEKLDRVDKEMRRHMEHLGNLVNDTRGYRITVEEAFGYMRDRGEREGISEDRMRMYEREFVRKYECPYCQRR